MLSKTSPNVMDKNMYWWVNVDEREKELAALAIEWEGTIGLLISQRGDGHSAISPRVYINNTKKLLLDFIEDLTKYGNIGGPYNSNNPKRKPMYTWIITGQRKVKDFLEEILPYLLAKQPQAEAVMRFCKSRLSHQNYRYTQEDWEDAELVRELNKV